MLQLSSNFQYIDNSKYFELADKNTCIIRINDLDYTWEESKGIGEYIDELRVSCNLNNIQKEPTASRVDGLSVEQMKLINHVIDENVNLNRDIIISSTNIELIKKLFKEN
jgi:hypothetical protein